MRHHRTSGKQIKYKISDSTDISNISLKQFLSHNETKQELTIYLSQKIYPILENTNILLFNHVRY